jgi:hypothetical protein
MSNVYGTLATPDCVAHENYFFTLSVQLDFIPMSQAIDPFGDLVHTTSV